jgi:hypothetical protein
VALRCMGRLGPARLRKALLAARRQRTKKQ